MESGTAHLLQHVGLHLEASTVAWCPVNGLLAVGGRISNDLACVHLIHVHCASRKVSLYVPLQGSSDGIASVSWSPAGSRRVLLTATLKGRLQMWSQQTPDLPAQQHITMQDWFTQEPMNLGSSPDATVDESTMPWLVCIKWLQASPAWVWSSSAMQQVDYKSGSIHGLFMPEPSSIDSSNDEAAGDELSVSWVRPDTLAFAAVLLNGTVVLCWAHWSAYGQLQWNSSSTISLESQGPTALLAADVTVCSNGIAVCYSTQQEHSSIRVVQLTGNPVHIQCCQLEPSPVELPVLQVAGHSQGDVDSSVTALSWDPSSHGTRLISVASTSSNGSGAMMYLLTQQQDQLLQVAQTSISSCIQQQQLVWLLDGMLLCSGKQGLQLFTAKHLHEIPVTFVQPHSRSATAQHRSASGLCQAIAASPHGVAVAAVFRSPPGSNSSVRSRLLAYNIPAYQTSSTGAVQAAAGRLLYALLMQRNTWDMVQHVLCAAGQQETDGLGTSTTTNVPQPAVVADILSLVDTKVTAQQPTLKSTYSAFWDVLKLAVLASTPGDEARTVSIDLRLRVLGNTMKPVFEVLREDATSRQREGRLRLPGLTGLHNHLADLVRFELACLKTWLVRRSGASADSGMNLHVPCVRHVMDVRPCNLLVMLYVLTLSSTQTNKNDVYSAYKQLTRAVPQSKDIDWEQTMRGLVPGALQLHYADTPPECLSSLALPPSQLLQIMESNAAWQQQPVLSDADITAEAMRLGLLPVRSPRAAGMYRHELQLHSSFRSQTEDTSHVWMSASDQKSSTSMHLSGMKRRHWETQLAAAMGDTLAIALGASRGMFDIAHMVPFDGATGGCLQSVDGSVLTHEDPPALDTDGKTAPKAVVDQCARGWVYACPISGEMWMRGP